MELKIEGLMPKELKEMYWREQLIIEEDAEFFEVEYFEESKTMRRIK